MAAHGLTHKKWHRPEAGRRSANHVIQLSWSHFWLLSGVLAGILSLFALIFLTARSAA